ncbi:hypothetical protein, partial [Halomonas sp. TD01]
GDAECVRRNANIDHSDPAAQEWERAVDAKALDDASKAMTAGVVMTPVGALGQGLAISGSVAGLLSGYLKDEFVTSATKEVASAGFERYAIARGVPAPLAARITAALDLAGVWGEVSDNATNIID